MPSLFLLLVMSLTVVSNQAKDKNIAPKVVAAQANAPKSKPATDTVETASDSPKSKVEPEEIAHPTSLIEEIPIPPAIAIIEAAAKDMLVQSETDAPIVVKFWASDKTELSQSQIAALVEQSADKPIAVKTVAAFFNSMATVEEWMNDEEKAEAQRFQKLIETLETQLENPQVYLIGERERTVVIIGKVKGGFGGIVTLVVET